MNLKPLKSFVLNLQFPKSNGLFYLQVCLQVSSKKSFVEEILSNLSIIVNQYENIFVAGDLNVDLLNPKCDLESYFSDLRDKFALTNLVKHKTCFNNKNGALLNVLLSNKPNCFQKTTIFETGLSDCHKLVITIFGSTFIKLPLKTITVKSYKHFNEKLFVHEFDQKLIQGDIYKTDDSTPN